MKIFITCCIFLLFPIKFHSQNKYGKDPDKCKTNLSLFHEAVKLNKYNEAYDYWKWCFENCPEASVYIYIDGRDILKSKIASSSTTELQEATKAELDYMNQLANKYFPERFSIVNNVICSFQQNEIDEFTGQKKIALRNQIIGFSNKTNFLSRLLRVDDNYLLTFQYKGNIGCTNDKSYVILKFEDNSTLRLMHIAGINCKTYPQFVANINEVRDSIMSKKVVKIRIGLSEKYADNVIFDQNFLIDGMECLTSMNN